MSGKKITIIVMECLAALMGLISAYGSSCPAFNPELIDKIESPELYSVMTSFQWVFIITTILSYVAGVGSLVMIWALATKKKWFYNTALAIAGLGCITGLIPYLLVTLNGGGTPSHLRAIIYGVLILMLLLIPGMRLELKDNISLDNVEEKSTATNISAILFFPGTLLWVQTLIVAPTHMLGSVNVYMFKSLQIGIGLVLMSMGIFIFGFVKYKVWKKK